VTALRTDVARSVQCAAACGAPPALLLAVALCAEAPASVGDAVGFLAAHGATLSEIAERGRMPTALAELEPELRFEPELARVRDDLGDHELRGRLVFGQLLDACSFFQVAAWAIAGLELSRRDAELLEKLGINTQLADVRIWPLAITRRVAAKSGIVHGICAGLSALLNPNMAVRPVGEFMRFLDRMEADTASGLSVERQLDDVVRRRERIPGVGRPVLGPDERNAQVLRLAAEFGRDTGPSWRMALEVEKFFSREKRQHINSAGLQGALMRDIGFSPDSATAMCVLYFIVPVLAQAVYASHVSKRVSIWNSSK
jgi:hypothetical protein